MEKFGIFELLDALSAIAASAEESAPQSTDAAFAPPDYSPARPPQSDGGAPERDAPPKEKPAPPDKGERSSENDALKGFLARHDAVAKRAKK